MLWLLRVRKTREVGEWQGEKLVQTVYLYKGFLHAVLNVWLKTWVIVYDKAR